MRITQDELKELFSYNESLGVLVRKNAGRGRSPNGYLGGVKKSGYMVGRIGANIYRIHHLVWLYFLGRFPYQHIDHINGNRSDNRIENLRECNPSQNHQNRKSNKNSKSKYLGVSWCKDRDRWVAHIKAGVVRKKLGYFRSEEDAYQAYLDAKKVLHTFNPVPR